MSKIQLQIPRHLKPIFESFSPTSQRKIIVEMIDYFYDGIEPEEKDQEWIYMKSFIDMAKEAYETRVSKGKLGGRPPKPKDEGGFLGIIEKNDDKI